MIKTEYARNLPHIQPSGATFFVTFCLKGTLPAAIVHELIAERDLAIKALNAKNEAGLAEEIYKEQRRYFARIDRILDASQHGPGWLKIPDIAAIVGNRILEADGESYGLLAYCIMPNHVHLVVDTAVQLDRLALSEAITANNYRQLY
jgi:putative transposase